MSILPPQNQLSKTHQPLKLVPGFELREELGPSRNQHRRTELKLTQPGRYVYISSFLWTPHSFHGCSDSFSRIGLVSLYDPILCYQFEYSMGGERKKDIFRVKEMTAGMAERKMRVIGSRGRTCSQWICRRSIRNTLWLRRHS